MRGEFTAVSALTVGLLAGLGLLVPVARGDARSPTISPAEIHEGMKGYGLTVFKGTAPERFDVEVIGVLHNFRPSQELILVKTPHPRLAVTKGVQGMSGSPIYLEGRLAGAYAYSLRNFSVEPIAGVTPIAPMLSELHRPVPAGFWPPEGGSPIQGMPRLSPPGHPLAGEHAGSDAALGVAAPGSNRFQGLPGTYDLGEHAREIERRLGSREDPAQSFVPAATPLLISGVGEGTASYIRTLFEPLGLDPQAAGGGEGGRRPGDPTRFVDGGSLGVWLMRGDMSMMSTGTVTHVEGDKLCGFGHPMMSGGDSALPATLARVLWIYASQEISFKIAESISPLGTLVQDRPSSVVVDESRTAPMFPVDIAVTGTDGLFKKNWHMEVAEDRFMSTGLTAAAIGGTVEETVGERRDVTWRLTSQVTLRGHGTLELEDFGVAIGGMPDSSDLGRSAVVRAVGDVMNNPWEDAHVESIKSTMSVAYDREMWHLRGVEASDDTVDAGGHVKLTVHLVPFTGAATTRTIDVPIPNELAGKDIEIEVLPGYEVPREVAAPESLPELLANEVRQTYPPRSLVVQTKLDLQGVAFRGHVTDALPSFAYDALRPYHTDVTPEPLNSYARTVTPMDRYVEGHDKIRLKVRQRKT